MKSKIFALLIGFSLCLPACAYQPSINETRWSQNSIQKIKRGLTPNELIQIFGPPDKQSVNSYGVLTAKPWQGLRYEYHFWKRGDYCINTFTFAIQDTTWLNDWNIDYTF